MKRRNFLCSSATVLFVSSLLSITLLTVVGCTSNNFEDPTSPTEPTVSIDPTDPSNYTEITTEEAQEIINNFDSQKALEEVETIAFIMQTSTIEGSETTADLEQAYYVDFTDESLYMYSYAASVSYSILQDPELLIAGSGDSYKYQYAYYGEIAIDNDMTFEEAKNLLNTMRSTLTHTVVYDETFVYTMTNYRYETDVTYLTYDDYIMLQANYDESDLTGIAYAIYNSKGLLKYAEAEISSTDDNGATYTRTAKHDAEYNVTFSRKSSL